MTSFRCTTLRRALAAGTFASFTTLAILAGGGSSASAQQSVVAANALAPEISSEADLAVEAFDEYVESESLADYLDYAKHRTATARLAARELGYNEFAMIDAWLNAPLEHQRAVLAAMTQVGVPYRSLAKQEGEGFDCSGLTSFAWEESGVEIARSSGDQIRAAATVARQSASAGVLVYYPGHVMMYLGVDDAVIHAVGTGRTVEIDTISSSRIGSVTFGDPAELHAATSEVSDTAPQKRAARRSTMFR